MTAEVKIKGQLPPSEHANGLIAILPDLAAHPRRKRVFVVIADAPEQKVIHCTDEETGDTWTEIAPTLHVRAIEQLDGIDAEAAQHMLGRAREQRQAHARNIALSLFSTDGD